MLQAVRAGSRCVLKAPPDLYRQRRAEDRGQRRDRARAAAADQGRARHRQDAARRGDRRRARRAADRLAHQIDDPRAAGPLRIRRRLAPARFATGRRARLRHRQLHQARQAVGGVHRARAPGAADRRDRQGGHRISQRSAARTRPHGILRLRDRRDGARAAAADRRHHLEQREGTARRVPAPLLLSLHPLSRSRRRCARSSNRITPAIKPRLVEEALRSFFALARDAGLEEEADRRRNCSTG